MSGIILAFIKPEVGNEKFPKRRIIPTILRYDLIFIMAKALNHNTPFLITRHIAVF